MEVYNNRADNLINDLRLNEISILSCFKFSCQVNRNQLEIVVEATCAYTLILITFGGRSLGTRRFRLYQIPKARMRSKTYRFQ